MNPTNTLLAVKNGAADVYFKEYYSSFSLSFSVSVQPGSVILVGEVTTTPTLPTAFLFKDTGYMTDFLSNNIVTFINTDVFTIIYNGAKFTIYKNGSEVYSYPQTSVGPYSFIFRLSTIGDQISNISYNYLSVGPTGYTGITGPTGPIGESGVGTALTENFTLALGSGSNVISYSYDGVTWNPATSANTFFTLGHCAAWNGTIWVAGGVGSYTIITSSDGINWVLNAQSLFTECWSVEWNGTLWVAGGLGTTRLAYSYDGLTWNAAPIQIFTDVCYKVSWNGSLWLAGGGNSATKMAYSYDGIIWNAVNTPFTSYVLSIKWAETFWVASGTSEMAVSYDGFSWTLITSPFDINCWDIAWNGNLLIAVGGDSEKIASSTDGISWTQRTSVFTTGCNSVKWNGSVWIVGGEGSHTLSTSKDGINWSVSQSGDSIITSKVWGLACRNIRRYPQTNQLTQCYADIINGSFIINSSMEYNTWTSDDYSGSPLNQAFTALPTGQKVAKTTLFLIHGTAGATAFNWASSISWGTVGLPTLSSSGTDILEFITFNNGTNWFGLVKGLGF
jgi:hypothetical protein